jgi:hypothetical protein
MPKKTQMRTKPARVTETRQKKNQRGGALTSQKSQAKKLDLADFYGEILKKAKNMEAANQRAQLKQSAQAHSRYQRLASGLPPNPEQHSWYHHHAPFAQNFVDYVCLKRSTLNDLGVFMQATMGKM